jgi:hypothetical protein
MISEVLNICDRVMKGKDWQIGLYVQLVLRTQSSVWHQNFCAERHRTMATHLNRKSITRAIEHVCKYGDTDVFPHLPELVFLSEYKAKIVDELSKLDLDSFEPVQAIEVLAPKSRFGFRVVHQLQVLETVLFTAAVIEIARDLEKLKESKSGLGPFAYRFDPRGGASLFRKDKSFRDWLKWQQEFIEALDVKAVVFTDIADFYQRIYFHRIENCLDSATANKGIKRFIEKTIKTIRSKQSYGIPVGGSASRILAEAVLSDSDAALLSEGIKFTRYVDDFRLFLVGDQEPYQALSFLAEQLFLSEGLTLNGQKTRVMSGGEFKTLLGEELPEKTTKAEEKAFEALSHIVYFDEEVDEEAVEELRSLNLVRMLEDAIKSEPWDFGEIKALFRALRITETAGAADFIIQNFQSLLPFAKELLIYFDSVRPPADKVERLRICVLESLLGQSAKSVPTIHAWLLEFFVRSILIVDGKELEKRKIENPLCDRQVALIRGLNGDVNFFRKHKTKFDGLSEFAKSSFILGATCLPNDEFSTWVDAMKPRLKRPLGALFCKWVKSKNGKLRETLSLLQKKETEAE